MGRAVVIAGLAGGALILALLTGGAVLGDNAMHVRRVRDAQQNEIPAGEREANPRSSAPAQARPNELAGGSGHGDSGTTEAPQGTQPNEFGLHQVVVNAEDGTKLAGLFLPASPAGRRKCALALHGIGDRGSNAVWLGRMLTEGGYSALLADSRAHGASGGDLATYGVLERHDLSVWINHLSSMPECRDGMYAYGASMGAGILLQSLVEERRLKAVVAECPFSSFVEVARHRIRGFLWETPWAGRLVAPPIVFGGTVYARLRYGIDLSQAAPEDSVVGVQTPILLIHGDADDNIPLEHSRAIAARNPAIQLWVVPGARHTEAASTAPEEFKRRLLGWFDSH